MFDFDSPKDSKNKAVEFTRNIQQQFRKMMNEKGITVKELAKRLGVTPGDVRYLLAKSTGLTVVNIYKIIDALELSSYLEIKYYDWNDLNSIKFRDGSVYLFYTDNHSRISNDVNKYKRMVDFESNLVEIYSQPKIYVNTKNILSVTMDNKRFIIKFTDGTFVGTKTFKSKIKANAWKIENLGRL